MAEQFCHYCRQFKKDDPGFRKWRHPIHNTPRAMCSGCLAKRRMTPEEREAAERIQREDERLRTSEMQRRRSKKKVNHE